MKDHTITYDKTNYLQPTVIIDRSKKINTNDIQQEVLKKHTALLDSYRAQVKELEQTLSSFENELFPQIELVSNLAINEQLLSDTITGLINDYYKDKQPRDEYKRLDFISVDYPYLGHQDHEHSVIVFALHSIETNCGYIKTRFTKDDCDVMIKITQECCTLFDAQIIDSWNGIGCNTFSIRTDLEYRMSLDQLYLNLDLLNKPCDFNKLTTEKTKYGLYIKYYDIVLYHVINKNEQRIKMLMNKCRPIIRKYYKKQAR